jgi:aspartyl-tRNA(Asn)/glutamyl-tRNA(Gln) amidotransferase subunit C
MTDEIKPEADRIDVAYVAHLARLHLTADEIRTFEGQLEQIVHHVNKMKELDLAGIEPTSHAVAMQNVFRADEVKPGLARDVVLANAPARNEDQFLVPRIVE